MPLTARDRMRLLRALQERLDGRDPEGSWTTADINLFLSEFGLPVLEEPDPWTSGVASQLAERLGGVSDTQLTRMYSAAFDVEEQSVVGASAAADDTGLWNEGAVRMFLTHSADHKAFAGSVAGELAVVGVHAFVAHDSMEDTLPWQQQIERALNTAEVFVALHHPEVLSSHWCQQEIGWALGRGIPHYVVRIGSDPRGFVGHVQWPSFGEDYRAVAGCLIAWLNARPEWSDRLVSGLFTALRTATNYFDAQAAAQRIDALGTLTDEQLAELDHIFYANDQVGGSILATRALNPIYVRHGRQMPTWPPF